MPRLVYVNPQNFRQQYVTAMWGDPNIPAGYVLTGGSDGAVDRWIWPNGQNTGIQQYMAGVNSGGFPAYTGDSTQRSDYPNGILN
jgi:hypothetical protein